MDLGVRQGGIGGYQRARGGSSSALSIPGVDVNAGTTRTGSILSRSLNQAAGAGVRLAEFENAEAKKEEEELKQIATANIKQELVEAATAAEKLRLGQQGQGLLDAVAEGDALWEQSIKDIEAKYKGQFDAVSQAELGLYRARLQDAYSTTRATAFNQGSVVARDESLERTLDILRDSNMPLASQAKLLSDAVASRYTDSDMADNAMREGMGELVEGRVRKFVADENLPMARMILEGNLQYLDNDVEAVLTNLVDVGEDKVLVDSAVRYLIESKTPTDMWLEELRGMEGIKGNEELIANIFTKASSVLSYARANDARVRADNSSRAFLAGVNDEPLPDDLATDGDAVGAYIQGGGRKSYSNDIHRLGVTLMNSPKALMEATPEEVSRIDTVGGFKGALVAAKAEAEVEHALIDEKVSAGLDQSLTDAMTRIFPQSANSNFTQVNILRQSMRRELYKADVAARKDTGQPLSTEATTKIVAKHMLNIDTWGLGTTRFADASADAQATKPAVLGGLAAQALFNRNDKELDALQSELNKLDLDGSVPETLWVDSLLDGREGDGDLGGQRADYLERVYKDKGVRIPYGFFAAVMEANPNVRFTDPDIIDALIEEWSVSQETWERNNGW